MKKIFLLPIFCCLLSWTFAQTIVEKKSLVNFSVKEVKGTITGLKGEIKFDPEDLEHASFNVTLDVNTINTDVKMRDKHLMKKPYFSSKNYPVLRFTSKTIEKIGDKYLTKGDLTIKGISLAVEIPFEVNKKGNQLILIGELTLNRKDYGIGEKTAEAMMGENVIATITCVLKK